MKIAILLKFDELDMRGDTELVKVGETFSADDYTKQAHLGAEDRQTLLGEFPVPAM